MRREIIFIAAILSLLTACAPPGTAEPPTPTLAITPEIIPGPAGALGESQIVDAVWSALEPNTSSGDRANWEAVEVRPVTGQGVIEQFEGDPAPGCWKGPTPTPNETVRPSAAYWFITMKPRPATPVPQERTISPTEPPVIPEPFVRQALFLVDSDTGRIVARKLFCVIY